MTNSSGGTDNQRGKNSKKTVDELSLSMEMETLIHGVKQELAAIGNILEATMEINKWAPSHTAVTMIIFAARLIARAPSEQQAGLLSEFPKLFKKCYEAEKADIAAGQTKKGK